MKKLLNIILLVTTVVGVFAVLTAYKGSNTQRIGIGYGIVHKQYIGESVVFLNNSGKLTDILFEEYFTPAQFTHEEAGKTFPENADIIEAGSKYIKYIKIAGHLFTGAANEEGNAVVYSGKVNGELVSDLTAWLKDDSRTQADYKWYIDACKNETVKYMRDASAELDVPVSYYNSNTMLQKTSSDYWGNSGTSYTIGIGHPNNMSAIKSWTKKNMDNAAWTNELQAGDTPKVDGIVQLNSGGQISAITGATLSGDTWQYLNVIKRAYQAAKQNN